MNSPSLELPQRRYYAEPTTEGFVLEGGEHRQRVRIRLRVTQWQVGPHEWFGVDDQTCCFGLFEVRRLIDWITHLSMVPWQPQNTSVPEWRLRTWVEQKARRSIAWVVGQERQRLMAAHVDPLVIDTQRAIFAACFRTGELVQRADFYGSADRYLLDDIQTYRAAAVAVNCFGDHLLREYCDTHDENTRFEWESIMGRVCQRLQRWRKLFSDTGRSYPALHRTLDRLPGNVSPLLVCELANTHLPRPIVDRLELTVLLLSLTGHAHRHHKVFQFAKRQEILRALSRVGHALHQTLSPRRTSDLSLFVQYLCDYPDSHTGNIVGLTDRSIGYHRQLAEQQAQEVIAEIGNDGLVAPPPVAPPAIPGLTFLSTVGSICREALLMGHCIASYIPHARNGESFLFHFMEDDEMASIEVDARGQVKQAFGPHNTKNRAARRAERLLRAWGSTFPQTPNLNLPVKEWEDIPF